MAARKQARGAGKLLWRMARGRVDWVSAAARHAGRRIRRAIGIGCSSRPANMSAKRPTSSCWMRPLVARTSLLSSRKGAPSKRVIAPPRFHHQQRTGGGVPWVEMELPEAVDAAAGGVGQVERGGTGAAHAVRAQRELLVEVDVGADVPFAAGKAGGQQRFGEATSFSTHGYGGRSARLPGLFAR